MVKPADTNSVTVPIEASNCMCKRSVVCNKWFPADIVECCTVVTWGKGHFLLVLDSKYLQGIYCPIHHYQVRKSGVYPVTSYP